MEKQERKHCSWCLWFEKKTKKEKKIADQFFIEYIHVIPLNYEIDKGQNCSRKILYANLDDLIIIT